MSGRCCFQKKHATWPFLLGPCRRRMNRDTLNKILQIVNKCVTARGYECIEVEWSAVERSLRIFIDHESGVNIDDCVAVNEILSEMPEIDEIVPGSYRMEISSPGIERPLRLGEHFKKHIGHKIKVKLSEKVDLRKQESGQLVSVDEDRVTIETEQGESWSFPIDLVKKAHLVHEWR